MLNYRELRGDKPFSFFGCLFVFVDDADGHGRTMLSNNHVHWFHQKLFIHEDIPRFVIRILYVRKNDVARFKETMQQLRNTLLICGYADYDWACEQVFGKIESPT